MGSSVGRELSSPPQGPFPPDPTAGWLSFLLPGLGQIYQGWYLRGIALFLAFILICLFRDGQVLLPIAAFLAGFEAYRPKAKKELWMMWDHALFSFWSRWFTDRSKPAKIRKPLYVMVGVVGFIGWFFLFAPSLYPFEAQGKLQERIDLWSDRVRDYRAVKGALPVTLSELRHKEDPADITQDPWGSEISIVPNDVGFELRSFGRDRKANTKDDIVYSFR